MSEKKITKHDLYEKLWASRDFEINHLWQRSIFLATFIVALFTIYFSVLNNFTSSKSVSEDIKIELVKSTESYEGYAIAQDDKSVLVVKDDRDESIIDKPCFQLIILDIICVFGFVFSVLWICMAKGSKYMYERHENGINAAHDNEFFDGELQKEVDVEFYESLWRFGDYTYIPRHGVLPLSDYDYETFVFNGAKYSSSKINIAIGYIFVFGWAFLTICNSIVINSGAVCCRIILGLLFLLLECRLALFLAFKILSDNSMTYNDFEEIVKCTFCDNYNPDGNQIDWISKFFATKNYVIDYVGTILSRYRDSCDNPLQRNILDEFKGHETELPSIRKLLSNEQLRNIFETALMHRESFNNCFKGTWYNPKDIKEEIVIDTFSIYGYLHENSESVNINSLDIRSVGTVYQSKLYSDTNWTKIRADFSYDLIEGANSYHLIYKESNGISLYATFELETTLSDDSQFDGNGRLIKEKCNRMNVNITITGLKGRNITPHTDDKDKNISAVTDEKTCEDSIRIKRTLFRFK